MSNVIRDAVHKIHTPIELYAAKYEVNKYEDRVYYKWIDGKFPDAEKEFLSLKGLNSSLPISWESSNILPIDGTKHSKTLGYIRPRFLFINNVYNPFINSNEVYKYALDSFELTEHTKIHPDTVIQLSNYRSALYVQLKRQGEGVDEINRHIADVMKVYMHERLALELDLKQRVILTLLIDGFMNYEINRGSYSKDIELDWIREHNHDANFSHLAVTVTNAIQELTTERDSLLDTSVKLAKLIDPIESIIERAILGNHLLTPKEYRYSTSPEPFQVAKRMIEKSKHNVYSLETIGKAMTIVRKYIVDGQRQTLYRKVSLLEKKIRDANLDGISDSTDPKTIKNWIRHYAEAIGVEFS